MRAPDDRAIQADRCRRNVQRAVAIEDDDFDDGLRLLDTTDDVEAGRGEDIRAAQGSLRARPPLSPPIGSRARPGRSRCRDHWCPSTAHRRLPLPPHTPLPLSNWFAAYVLPLPPRADPALTGSAEGSLVQAESTRPEVQSASKKPG